MAREHITIDLNEEDKTALERLVEDRNTPAKIVWRARIVLATAAGLGTMAITRAIGTVRGPRRQERFGGR